MENILRERRLKLITKLLFIFIILVLASEVIYCYVYKSLANPGYGGASPVAFRTTGSFFGARTTSIMGIDLSIFALSAAFCVIGIINSNKKKIVNMCLILLGGIFFLKAVTPFYPSLLAIIPKFKHAYYVYQWEQFSYLIIMPLFVLLPIVLCLCAHMKKSDGQKENARSDKSGFGGFFIVAMIRNVFLPISQLSIVIMLMLDNIPFPDLYMLQGIVYNSRMLLIVAFGFIVSVIALIKMFKKHCTFVPTIISAEAVLLYYYIHKIITVFIFAKYYYIQQGYFNFDIYTDISMVIGSALFIVYYVKSSRVKNTFTNNSTLMVFQTTIKEVE